MLADLGFSTRYKTLDLRGLKTNKKVSHRPACVGESTTVSAAQVGDVFLTFYCFQIMSESSSSLLCVIFDINPLAWGLKTLLEAHANGDGHRQETIVQGLDATLTFINSFLLMTHGNQVAVVGVHPEASGTLNVETVAVSYVEFVLFQPTLSLSKSHNWSSTMRILW